MVDFNEDDEDEVARAMAIRFEEKGGVYYNNDDKINNEKVVVADIAQYVAGRTLFQYEDEFEVTFNTFQPCYTLLYLALNQSSLSDNKMHFNRYTFNCTHVPFKLTLFSRNFHTASLSHTAPPSSETT